MNDHILKNSFPDKLSDVLSQIQERLTALEDSVSISKTVLESRKTQASQTFQSEINEERLKVKNERADVFMSELMKTANFPRTSSVVIEKDCKFKTFLWVFIQILALLISCIYIKDAYTTWRTSPIVIYQSNELKSVKDIEAPAVTICFPNGITSEKSEQIFMSYEECLNCNKTTENEYSLTCSFNEVCDRDILYFGFILSQICGPGNCYNCTLETPFSDTLKLNEVINGSFYSIFQELLPSCNLLPNFTIQVDSRKPERGCDDKNTQWFVSGLTDKQLCMTYNSQSHSHIYRDGVVLPLPPPHVIFGIEHTVPVINTFNNLSFSFDTNYDYGDYWYDATGNCNSYDEMSVYVHNPHEIPLTKYLGDNNHIMSRGRYYQVIVTPQLITADQDIAAYSPFHRNCFYPEERELLLYTSYSKTNCEIECHVYCSIQNCGCVSLDLPRPNASIRVCQDSYCEANCDCKCLPECEALTYSMDLKEKYNPSSDLLMGIRMEVTFKTKEFRPEIRYSLSSFSEFVAYSLGVLGTFNGLSVIALWKLMYLLMLKLWNLVLSYSCKNYF